MTTCAVSTDLRAHMREVDEADRQAEEVLRKFIGDFLYYLRRGHSIRNAWRLAQLTI